jgi:SNF2 family DNA or RNA helicase
LDDGLFFWGEKRAEASPPSKRPGRKPHRPRPERLPYDAGEKGLAAALAAVESPARGRAYEARIAWLPTAGDVPVASSPIISGPPDPEASHGLAPWTVTGCVLSLPEAIDLLCACVGRDLLAPGFVVGKDLAYAATVLRLAGSLVARQQYLPDIAERGGAFRAVWTPVWGGSESGRLRNLAEAMPDSARALGGKADAPPDTAPLALVEGCVGALVDGLVRGAGEPGAGTRRGRGKAAPAFDSPHDEWLHALRSANGTLRSPAPELARLAAQVREWRRPVSVHGAAPYRLTFRLEEPQDGAGEAAWFVRYLLQATHDQSLLVPAEDVWTGGRGQRLPLARAGFDPREHLLASLGQASGIDPLIERSLRSPAPAGYVGDATAAYEFLGRKAVALEQAGFGVLLPAWWTRKGAKDRLTARATVKSPKLQGGTGLSLDDLVRFEWQVAVGGVPLTLAELRELARLKQPLVRVRGLWVHVSAEEIEAALRFWKEKGGTASVRDVVRMSLGAAEPPGGLAFEGVTATGWVADLLASLQGHAAFEELPPPEGLRGTLRPYQLRGYSWLAFLRRCGLGACLADDMGLGKTVQMLALIQREWSGGVRRPVLLVCPTSVVGNWEKEAARFTPELPVLVHHGGSRAKGGAFAKEARRHAIVLSSYALLHRDTEALAGVEWGGVVLDEAQNVKNPETKQARAARALRAGYRVALTGTPVENNVGDLWSLLEFLNPGLLGSQAHFKRTFFVPIQAGRDPEAAERLKRLTGPFILRRLKTDKTVIADLPEKLEAKVFCTLTKEQASLYAAVVADAAEALDGAEGIKRKGVVLATLSKLKQVCNHPAQFLGDNSAIPGRSGKLARLTEMLEEALAAGDRALVFSQFAEMGAILRRHLEDTFGHEALFLHGAVPKKARDRMVERFQGDGDGPPLFVLSLKAGGTGLNLTRANHVFHFDRWWNPAVENQATDRAFRIGQRRRVQVHKFLCAGTLEEKIDEMIERKKQVAEAVVGTGEGWLTELSTAELKELIALRPEAVSEE